jgi:serine-type D-Ala-D-Ala carboxypeptidase (penicillin-binding protein 5/6)
MVRRLLPMVAVLALLSPAPVAAQPEKRPAPKAAADPLDGPPFVSAKAWVVLDGKTGKVLGGNSATEVRPMASTSKIMTAWAIVFGTEIAPGLCSGLV